ncbi:MAG TPA: NAD-dependent epimerase/dehydratase family protein [Anaerolineae bacterium]|nr:NAD-dependent epimerase/dehydratase family protein [Anaerolineae bacterium]
MELATSVFLTGATGFIGARLTRRLLAEGVAVSALTLPHEAALLPPGARAFVGDVTDGDAVQQAMRAAAPEAVIHLAAVGVTQPNLPLDVALHINAGGTVHVLQAAREVGARRIVLAGTSYEYGARRAEERLDPFNAYSASKVAAWACARAAYNAWGAPVVWLRLFQVYGPGQCATALVPAATRAALCGDDFPMTGGEQQRDFIFVDDVVDGFLTALTAPQVEGGAFDLGTETLQRVRDVVALIWQLTGARGQMRPGALPYRPGEVPVIPANAARTHQMLGWQAQVTLEEGLRKTIEEMRDCNGTQGGDWGSGNW